MDTPTDFLDCRGLVLPGVEYLSTISRRHGSKVEN